MLASVYLCGDGSVPSLKLENWPKIWCTLAYIVGVCWGNWGKRFYLAGE